MIKQQTPLPAYASGLPDHDFLVRLAREDPTIFEALRLELLERAITSAPEQMQARLRGLQFRIDAIRRLSRSPLGATVKIAELMWRSFLEMDQHLQELVRPTGTPAVCPALPGEADRERHDARIIQFQPRQPGTSR